MDQERKTEVVMGVVVGEGDARTASESLFLEYLRIYSIVNKYAFSCEGDSKWAETVKMGELQVGPTNRLQDGDVAACWVVSVSDTIRFRVVENDDEHTIKTMTMAAVRALVIMRGAYGRVDVKLRASGCEKVW